MGSRGAAKERTRTVESDSGERGCGCESCAQNESDSYCRCKHLFEKDEGLKEAAGKMTVYMRDGPHPGPSSPACEKEHSNDVTHPMIVFDAFDSWRPLLRSQIADAKLGNPGVTEGLEYSGSSAR